MADDIGTGRMEEVRQAWNTLRTGRKLSVTGHGNGGRSSTSSSPSTVWYDLPAPVIVHCREFTDDGEEQPMGTRLTDPREQIIYQNTGDQRSSVTEESRRRHRNTLELTALASVRTDLDGVPTISFSFLQAGEKDIKDGKRGQDLQKQVQEEEELRKQLQMEEELRKQVREDEELQKQVQKEEELQKQVQEAEQELQKHVKEEELLKQVQKEESQKRAQEELYDFPKNTTEAVASADVKVVESFHRDNEIPCGVPGRILVESTMDPGTERAVKAEDEEDEEEFYSSVTVITDYERRSRRNNRSSVRSTGPRSRLPSDCEDPGVAPMSNGSYSEPEYPANETTTSRRRARKRRLGNAWQRMRAWLKDETVRINEVVNKHARMQAVGALTDLDLARSSASLPGKNRCCSYDLTRARTQELGSVTRVEEFGLTSVTEETNSPGRVSRVDQDAEEDPDEEEEEDEEDRKETRLGMKTVSSDDILADEKSQHPADHHDDHRRDNRTVSYSMDRLCSDGENETAEEEAGRIRDYARKGGLIKRRMLGSIRGLMASTHLLQGHENVEEGGSGGFEDVRRYVKQGGDFCKELAAILHERAELEATYAKGLSKLSSKLTKACTRDQGGNSSGGVNEAWRCVGEEMEVAAEAHRIWGITLTEQLAKPLRVGVAEAQARSRKSIENSVDKAAKSLQEWRTIAGKSKKQSFACARENERLQDLARLQSIGQSQQSNNKAYAHHMTEKEASKLETRRRKAEDSSRRADTEFYTVSVRAERARLEYESTVRKGAKQMELLEEERLRALKDLANVYLAHLQALAPRLQQSADRLTAPIRNCSVSHDVEILKNLIHRLDSNEACNVDQLLPDFYAEHVTLAMNRERRKQALVRVLHLIRQDLERERRGREGLETLHRAFIKTPAFAADESTQNVTEKLHHMRSMLMYLEAARYKVGGTLAEVEGSKRGKHPLAEHILVSRDKQGLQQSVLKIPSWAKTESFEIQDFAEDEEIEAQLTKEHHHHHHQETDSRHWTDRTAGDGNSENPPDEDDFSDFDDFSNHSEDNNNQDVIVEVAETTTKSSSCEGATEQCRAIYQYSANLNDELSLSPGDLITVHQKQSDGWWIGECKGRTGIFPATYVQVIH